MNINEMKGNECAAPDKNEELPLDKVKLLEISEAIDHLDNMITEVERALHINVNIK